MPVDPVTAVPVGRELDERFANAQTWIGRREYRLVRITDEAGRVDWGECWGPVAGDREVVAGFLAPRLVGRDPEAIAAIHENLRFAPVGLPLRRPGARARGVDLALFDLAGRRLDRSAAVLLGGRRRDAVRAYATGGFWPDAADRETVIDAVAEARGHVDAGFDALKLKIGTERNLPFGGPETDLALVRAVREAVGPDVTLFADADCAYDRPDARRVGRGLADLGVGFVEEPVAPTERAASARLNRTLDVPVAGGESWAVRETLADRLDRGCVGVVQPEVTSAGGLTAAPRVVELATAAGVRPVHRVFGSAVAVAASLQLLATRPTPPAPRLEFDRTPPAVRGARGRSDRERRPAGVDPRGAGAGDRARSRRDRAGPDRLSDPVRGRRGRWA